MLSQSKLRNRNLDAENYYVVRLKQVTYEKHGIDSFISLYSMFYQNISPIYSKNT